MNNNQTYILLARCLALDYVESHRQSVIDVFIKDKVSIEKIVRMADNHLILQALYPNLEKHQLIGYIPGKLADHLKKIYDLNSERNKKILQQIESINLLLKTEKITPLYLKGAGNIIDGLYSDTGIRILHDIDFLVEENKLFRAAEILLNNGYRADNIIPLKDLDIDKHFPILHSNDFPAYVEIHKIPVRARYLKGFPVETIFLNRKLPANARNCFVMSDDHKLIHSFINSQLEQDGHYYARSSLRYLYDSLLLSLRVDPEQIFSDYGYHQGKINSYLKIMYNSFGIKPPARFTTKLFTQLHSFRYWSNLKCRFISLVSSLLLRMHKSYIEKPVMAIFYKDLRISLIKKLGNRDWYGKHLRGIFGKRKL